MEEMKISVVMSCYNSERFLRQSIDSILMQSYREFEFIIWNDGSTDSTGGNRFSAKRQQIRVIKH